MGFCSRNASSSKLSKMGSNNTSPIPLIIFCILLLIKLASCQTIISCNNTANFTTTSSFGKNRDLLLNSLPSKVSANTSVGNYFYSTSVGEGADKVYGHAICRADLSPQMCSDSLSDSIQNLLTTCPNQKEAISISAFGIRYANRPIDGEVVLEPTRAGYNIDDLVSNSTVQFYQIWYQLMDQVTERTAMEPLVKYATGETNSTENQTIYVRMQCFPDLAPSKCTYCLREAVNHYEGCCHGKVGGYVQKPSCWFRWDLYPFYNFTGYSVAPPPPMNTTIIKENGGIASKTVVIVVAVVVSLLVVVNLLYILYHRNKTSNFQHAKDINEDGDISTIESLQFDIETLQVATNNFSVDNKLGEGGFGAVYKGKLPDERVIAVKRWSKNSSQGKVEFENEIVLLAKLQHRNLVRLLGYCFEEKERLLVYEFIPNKSLDSYIFDSKRRLILDWDKRYNIIEGIARGILYLHQDSRIQIIHRDLKPSNILLDDQMNPKISDFGTAKLFEVDQSQVSTLRIVGTYGYMAPEYAMHGHISIKSDVFSFGVLVLEIISGQKVSRFGYNAEVNDDNLLTYAWKNWEEGTPLNLIDKISLSSGSTQEMIRCIHIGLLCVQEDLAKRPTMSSIVLMLSSPSVSLPMPSTPAYYMSTLDLEAELSRNFQLFTTDESINQISISEQGPR